MVLLSETEFRYYLSVLFDVHRFKIIEHSLSATYHFKKTATGMIVVGVFGKVRVKMIDARGQKSNLYFCRTGVVFADLEIFDNCLFFCNFALVNS